MTDNVPDTLDGLLSIYDTREKWDSVRNSRIFEAATDWKEYPNWHQYKDCEFSTLQRMVQPVVHVDDLSLPIGRKRKATAKGANMRKKNCSKIFNQRKAQQKKRVFSTIKTGFNKLCHIERMRSLIDDMVRRCSQIACEASLLANFHILRLLETEQGLPVINQTFFNQCVSCCANQGENNRTCEGNNKALWDHFQEFKGLYPDGYQYPGRVTGMAQVLVCMAQQFEVNMRVSTRTSLLGRMGRYFRLLIRRRVEEMGSGYLSAHHETRLSRSFVSLMTKASILPDSSVTALVGQYTRLKDQHAIPQDDLSWMQSVCNEVKKMLGPDPLSKKRSSESYLPFLFHVLQELQRYNNEHPHLPQAPLDEVVEEQDDEPKQWRQFRLFSLLPQKHIRPMNIEINSTSLGLMHKQLYGEAKVPDDDLWQHYFPSKITKGTGTKKFEKILVTDGMSVSMCMSREKTVALELTDLQKRQQAAHLLASADRILGLDPGVSNPFTTIAYEGEELDKLQDQEYSGDIVPVVASYGKREWRRDSGATYRSKMTDTWMRKNKAIAKFNATVHTGKTADLGEYVVHIKHVLANLIPVLEFFSAKRFKRLRFKTYIRRQKAIEKIVARLRNGIKNTVIVYGDGKFRGSHEFRRKIGLRMTIVHQDEFRTSKLCCCCGHAMEGLLDEMTGKRSYKLRVCENNVCVCGIWDRDVNAAMNILKLWRLYAQGKPKPLPFCRGNTAFVPIVMEDQDENQDIH